MRRWFRRIIPIILIACAGLVAWSQDVLDSTLIPVPLFLRMDDGRGEYLGEVEALISEDGDVSIVPNDLLSLVAEDLRIEVLDRAAELFDDGDVAPLGDLDAIGITVAFDWDELSLLAVIPPNARRPERISLVGRRAVPIGAPVAPEVFSLIANLDLWTRLAYETALFEYAVTPEIAVNIYTVALEAHGGVQSGDEPLFLDYARATWDIPTIGYRLQGGDLTWRTTDLVGVRSVLGVSFFRARSLGRALDPPERVLADIFLPMRSDVDIFLNESRLARRTLDAGNYELGEVPLLDGVNTVVAVWEGEDGPQEIELILPHDRNLLDAGVLDAGLAAGVAERDFARPIVMAYQRYGVTPAFTLGMRQGVELLDLQVDVGLQALLATQVGTFGLEPDVGIGPGERILVDVPLSYSFLDPRPDSYLSFGITGAFRSLTTGAGGADSTRVSGSGYVSFALPEGFSITPRASYVYGVEDGSHDVQVRAGLRKSIRGGAAVSADAGFSFNGETSFTATVTYSASFPEHRQNLFLQQNLATQEFTAHWSRYAGGGPEDVDFGASAKIPVDFSEVLNLSADIGYVNPYVRGSLSHSLSGVAAEGDLLNRTTLGLQSALVVAGEEVGVTLPVLDSFVIVAPGAGLDEMPLSISRDGARADLELDEGIAILSSLSSYSPLGIEIEPSEVVFGMDERELRYVVTPTYRSGTVVRPVLERRVYVGGVLLDEDAEPVPYALGRWERETDGGEFFTDDDGYFEIYSLPPGEYVLSLITHPDLRYRFRVPDDADEYLDLNELNPQEVDS